MYLILWIKKTLLVDLSNKIICYDNPAERLPGNYRNHKIGNRKLIITVTHNHGDHLGMLPAFVNDPEVEFLGS